ncbi:MAG: 4Fe-4S dicluster domain-containing protein [Deltaproteobacteria bacterium]|nr:MAG: 4Fe-4S dicluster domain-containing protein [Deltaproteobacteria bacterium]
MSRGEIQRMHEDLSRALKKPEDERSWVMVVDVRKCVGCHACSVSCMAENVAPPGSSYRVVFEVESGEYPTLDRFFMPTNCQQCDKPPCKAAADKIAKDAITKRKDGIVVFNYEKLKKNPKAGEAAQKACPYTAIVADDGTFYTENTPVLEPYETRSFFEYGKKLTRKGGALKGAIRKCTFCLHRLREGMLPACVSTCIGRAMYFGDGSDPKSLVSELISKKGVWRIKSGEGTEPRVYYLGFETRTKMIQITPTTCLECHE